MPAVGEVSFELERFEWTADDRLEVVGRWNGVRGRRISRPALTVEAGGRRQRLSGNQESDEPWTASFAWSGDDIAGAELEIGRTLVVELPAPRRRRRRSGAAAESDLRAQLEETRLELAAARAELARPRDEAAELAEVRAALTAAQAELAAARDDDERDRLASALAAAEAELAAGDESDELAKARAALTATERERDLLAGELRAREAEDAAGHDDARAALIAAEGERDRLAQELAARDADLSRLDTQRSDTSAELAAAIEAREASGQELAGLRLAHGSLKAAHESLEDELEELRGVREERDELVGQLEQFKANAGDQASEKSSLNDLVRELQAERETLAADLAVAREEIARLERDVAVRDRSLDETREDAERRVESERATSSRATNTEIHARLATAREETQKTIAAEAEETERLRAELEQLRADHERQLGAERAEVARLREELLSSEVDEDAEEASRRMVERITRDLERERAVSRNLKRELDTVRSDLAEQRRAVSSSTANGTLQMDDAPVPARAVRTPEGTRRRVDAARANAAHRVPKVPPSPVALWAVRVFATLLVAFLGILLVVLIKTFT